MADRPRRSKGESSRSRRSSRTAEAGVSEDTPTPPTSPAASGDAVVPDASVTLPEAQERIAELVADLKSARTTIRALLDKAERKAMPVAADPAEIARGPDGAEGGGGQQAEVEAARENPLALSGAASELDKLVRLQTRALAESEAQLRRKNTELERLNEMKAEFISIAAHELRTPLTSIVGYLDLMHEGRFGTAPDAMARPLASLRRNAHRLRRLVDEMLDVSRIEQRQIHLYRVPCDLGEVVTQVVVELESPASEKALELSALVDSPPLIYADVARIRQAVSKLVASTIRYTPEGGSIVITVDAAPQDRFAGSWTRLQVKYSGIGIPRHLHSRIFEPFFDVESAKHHTSSGPDSAGLGLYIARGLIDLHGGLITVDSEEGAFTEFTVLLPVASAEST